MHCPIVCSVYDGFSMKIVSVSVISPIHRLIICMVRNRAEVKLEVVYFQCAGCVGGLYLG